MTYIPPLPNKEETPQLKAPVILSPEEMVFMAKSMTATVMNKPEWSNLYRRIIDKMGWQELVTVIFDEATKLALEARKDLEKELRSFDITPEDYEAYKLAKREQFKHLFEEQK